MRRGVTEVLTPNQDKAQLAKLWQAFFDWLTKFEPAPLNLFST
jgi:hypothetical protein